MALILDSSPFTNPFFSSEDKNWVHTVERRYELEDLIQDAISRGDAKQACRYLSMQNDGETFFYLGDDPTVIMQRMCRVINVSSRIAARRGGLPALYLHNISEKFGLIITRTHSPAALRHELPLRIVSEYANAVAHYSTHGYGKLINRAVQYLSYHISERIILSEMAEQLFVNSTYLSRRFHHETGLTITEYINHMRIDMAKVLLEQGRMDIAEIAMRVGYQDACYFSKVFRRITGHSPREHLRSIKGSC